MSIIYKPNVVIDELGELGRLPDGGIINAGGVEGPNFTVGGKNVVLVDGTVSGTTFAQGYEHIQAIAVTTWTIVHSKGSKRVQVSIWDNTDELVYADTIKIMDLDTVQVTFNTAISGRAILVIF